LVANDDSSDVPGAARNLTAQSVDVSANKATSDGRDTEAHERMGKTPGPMLIRKSGPEGLQCNSSPTLPGKS
jgi:hypothetical protein